MNSLFDELDDISKMIQPIIDTTYEELSTIPEEVDVTPYVQSQILKNIREDNRLSFGCDNGLIDIILRMYVSPKAEYKKYFSIEITQLTDKELDNLSYEDLLNIKSVAHISMLKKNIAVTDEEMLNHISNNSHTNRASIGSLKDVNNIHILRFIANLVCKVDISDINTSKYKINSKLTSFLNEKMKKDFFQIKNIGIVDDVKDIIKAVLNEVTDINDPRLLTFVKIYKNAEKFLPLYSLT